LTTVAQPREELARRAAALLLARIEGGIADERVQVILEPRLVMRRSTAPFRLRRS
jgi:DNA-binding LacI/PurR family transcriptional regulator